MSKSPSILLAGAAHPFAAEIALRLSEGEGGLVEAPAYAVEEALGALDALDALVIVAPAPRLGSAFFDVDDVQLEAGLDRFLDLFEVFHRAIPRLRDGAGVVLVETRGHLGGWGGAHEMAFDGAGAGLMRSVTLENMNRGVRANVVAVELPGGEPGRPGSDPQEVADLVAFLLSPQAAALNGELLLANGGRSLLLREGRDQRGRAPAAPSTSR